MLNLVLPHYQEFVNYVAGEVEADVWERVAVSMTGMQQRGGFIRAFISDLSRVVDGREVGSLVTTTMQSRPHMSIISYV